jgi:REP element-mobilizing transposase RayT
MGRDLRTIDNERIYHVMCRGNNRGPLAWDRHDYESLVRELSRAATQHRWDVLAWCLMPNHYHVLMRTPFGGFSDGFQVANGSHARRTNRRHGRSDHLFKNRPLSVEVSSDAHLVTAILYIARNPVEAGLCANAGGWPWGSYRATIGAEPAPRWLAVTEVESFFGRTPEAARSELARLVHDGHLPVSDTDGEAPPLRT